MAIRLGGRKAVWALVGVLSLGACTGGEGESADSSKTTRILSPGESTSTTVDPQAAEVIAGYEAYWDAVLAASDPPDPSHALLAAHAKGEELAKAKTLLAAQKQFGEVARGTFDLDPSVRSIDDDRAELADCWTPDISLFDRASGDLKTKPPAIGHQLLVELELEDEAWKVSLITDEGPCRIAPSVTGDTAG